MFLDPIHFIKEEAFSKSFCEKIMNIGYQKKLELAKIQDGNQVNRKSHVTFIQDKDIESEVTKVVNEVNEKTGWNFLLREFEPLQYTIYNVRDHYDWHIDSHGKPYKNGLIRKLSFTICLNDNELENNNYTGGDFEICLPHPYHNKNKYFRFRKVFKQGTIIVFPSHIWHKVHPVVSGTRKVLVGWVVGKAFQ
jgi:PKHD-type hydroxylase